VTTSLSPMVPLKAPFPWFGGKSRVAHEVWRAFGDVSNYVEPFAGSLAVLLNRPTSPRVETVNDIDCWISNFWRALQANPEAVAVAADWPVNEADLHARHLWLVNQTEFRERMKTDPEYYDAKIAGWWCWGICQWIGSGWCAQPQWSGRTNAGRQARGINAIPRNGRRHPLKSEDGDNAVWSVRPHLTSDGQGQGIHRKTVSEKHPRLNGFSDVGVHKKIPYAGPDERGLLSRSAPKKRRGYQNPLPDESGNAKTWRKRPNFRKGQGRGVSRQIPHLSGDAGASGSGLHASAKASEGLLLWLLELSSRLRRVRVCCGNWKRVVTPSVTHKIGLTGVFLDPPYDMRVVSNAETNRDGAAPSDKLYEHHDNEVSAAVRQWAIENGNNPLLRIAVCGYEGEHDFPSDWKKIAWKANGGFGNQRPNSNGAVNSARERIWFSPHCLTTPTLFDLISSESLSICAENSGGGKALRPNSEDSCNERSKYQVA
jgi:D12 class N6 adenine-specific DNA methyltransferase